MLLLVPGMAGKTIDVGPVAIASEETPVGFLVVLRGGVSTLRKVLKELEGLPLIRALVSKEHNGRYTCYIIMDARGKLGSVDGIASRIGTVKGVEDVRVYKPSGRMLTAAPFDILEFSGQRAIVLVQSSFAAFIKSVRKNLGPSGSAILYHMGALLGQEIFRGYMGLAGYERSTALSITRDLLKACGLGRVEFVSIDEDAKTATVRVWNNFECELFAGSGLPSSHFVRGVIAGWLSAYFGKEVSVREIRCIAKRDACCEFEVT